MMNMLVDFQNPYPSFKQLRINTPIIRIEPQGYWAVARYQDVEMILKNPTLFTSSGMVAEPACIDTTFLLMSRSLLGLDGRDHLRLRRLLAKALTPTKIRAFIPKIQTICGQLLRKLWQQKEIDFVSSFSVPLPIMVISDMLGIDPEKQQDFRRWVMILLTWRKESLTQEKRRDLEKMYDYFNALIDERKKTTRNDLISYLVSASEKEHLLTVCEVFALVRLLVVAATDTTTHLLTNSMLSLINFPYIAKSLRENRQLIPKFIEESLRYDSPTLSVSRRVTRETEIAGRRLQKDDIVLPLIGSANHDEKRFDQPDVFDLNRITNTHLTFGTGTHTCLGSQLARLQARIAFEEILSRFQDFSRDPHQPLSYLKSFFFRGVLNLKMTWTPMRVQVN